jgi:DNA-binding MarR family transcriptional regulator
VKPPLEVQTYGAMVAFVQRVQRAADAALAGSGVTPAQFFVLATLKRRDGAQQSELAEALGVTAGNISQLVAKLEEARLVRRADRGKAKVVTLTAKGDALVARLAPQHDAFLETRFASLDVGERRALLALLERLLGGN